MEKEHNQVAVFIDFENLVFGIQDPRVSNSEEEVDIEPIVRLAEEYGRVVQAHAYADWRNRVFNQYQMDLYKLGIDIVHVMGKKSGSGFKNAVDIKMAVDTIETIFTFSDVDTFVIVSGDRDFIHVLKMLRRHGKHVVGISPARSASEDLAQLTDRFIRYESLSNTYFEQETSSASETLEMRLRKLRDALSDITTKRPEGVRGSELKGLLRRNISATFDESDYGFSRFIDLVRAFPNDLRIELERNGGDMKVFPVEAKSSSPKGRKPNASPQRKPDQLIADSGLKRYRFEKQAKRRRKILDAMFSRMREGKFSQNDLYDSLQGDPSLQNLSATELSKYFLILFQSRVLSTDKSDEDLPTRARKMTLSNFIKTSKDLIERYELSIVYKVLESTNGAAPTSREILSLLGLNEKSDAAYASRMLKKAKEIQSA